MTVKVKNLYKTYFSETFLGKRTDPQEALKDINFSINKGEILGVVGESGSGKSTLAKIICGLELPTSGSIIWDEKIKDFSPAQMVFQNPSNSINPKLTVGYILKEAIALAKGCSIREISDGELRNLLSTVGLKTIDLKRYAHQFSGGQQQRIAIARALALKPALLVCDEPVSSLDISIQAQVINLIKKINREEDIAVIFIAHDIEVVSIISHNILVMNEGKIVEKGRADRIIKSPAEKYTKRLISSVPVNPYIQ